MLADTMINTCSMVMTLQDVREEGTKRDGDDMGKKEMKKTVTKIFKILQKDMGLGGVPGSKHVMTVSLLNMTSCIRHSCVSKSSYVIAGQL